MSTIDEGMAMSAWNLVDRQATGKLGNTGFTLVTVLKTGGEFTIEHEKRIRQHMRRGMRGVLDSVCLTDDPAAMYWFSGGAQHDVAPLALDLPGWWSMLEMFRAPGPALYLDLDTHIRGDLSPIVERVKALESDEVLMVRPWGEAERKRGVMLSGFMGWSGDLTWIVDELDLAMREGAVTFQPRAGSVLTRDGQMKYRGELYRNDQDWIVARLRERGYRILAWQDELPGAVQSYKRDLGRDITKATGPVVVFHGRPRPWEVGL